MDLKNRLPFYFYYLTGFLYRLDWQKQRGKIKIQEKTHKRKNKLKNVKVSMADMIKLSSDDVFPRNRRSISRNYFVEALVVADSGMVEFHEDGQIEMYILTLMNMVSSTAV